MCVSFFGGHLPQTSGFRSAKQILVVSFATQARAFILSDRNIFHTPGGGRTTAGSNAPGAFLVGKIKRCRVKSINHELYDPMVFWEAEEPAFILRHRAQSSGAENKTDRHTPKILHEKKIP